MVGCSKYEVGGEGEMIDSVTVRGEGRDEGSFRRIPELYCLVKGRRVNCSSAAPADARDGTFVATKDEVDASGHGIPDADRSVFGAGCKSGE